MKPDVFKREVHADKVILLPFYYGFHVGLEVPEDDVYRMLKIIEENAAELAKADATFAQIAKDMAGIPARGVESSADLVPIHPGLAKYMREKGVWDAKWDSRVATQVGRTLATYRGDGRTGRARPPAATRSQRAMTRRHASLAAAHRGRCVCIYAVRSSSSSICSSISGPSEGGPTLLAVTLVPVTFVLFTLDALRKDELYPRPAAAANYAIACVYVVIARSPSPCTCTSSTTRSARCAPGSGARPISRWAG